MPRAKKTEPQAPAATQNLTPEQVEAIIQARIQDEIKQVFNPTAEIHRCGACAKLTDNTYDVCRPCYTSRAIPSHDSFIASFVGYPKGLWPADLCDVLKDQLEITFEDLKKVIDEQSEDDAKEYIINLIRLALREPINPITVYYPEVATGRFDRATGEQIFEQGRAVIESTPLEKVQWSYPHTPETPSEKKARLQAAEDALVSHRERTQQAHLDHLEREAKRTQEAIEKVKAARNVGA